MLETFRLLVKCSREMPCARTTKVIHVYAAMDRSCGHHRNAKSWRKHSSTHAVVARCPIWVREGSPARRQPERPHQNEQPSAWFLFCKAKMAKMAAATPPPQTISSLIRCAPPDAALHLRIHLNKQQTNKQRTSTPHTCLFFVHPKIGLRRHRPHDFGDELSYLLID